MQYNLEFPYLSTHSNPVPVHNPLKLRPQPVGSTMPRVPLLEFEQANINVRRCRAVNCDDDRLIHGKRCFAPYIAQAGLPYSRSVSLSDAVLWRRSFPRLFTLS